MLRKDYTPMFFLSALGNGGLSVSFFMYLMFITQHPNSPIPTFSSLSSYFVDMSVSPIKIMIVLAGLAILYFAFHHYRLLIWNIRQFLEFKKTEAYTTLKNTNAEVSLMAIPLALAMAINVVFILGAVFVPGLWGIVEYLFPAALVLFGLVGILALAIFGEYFTRILTTSSFDFIQNNNLSQMIAMFAFAMVGVGFAASAAMSHTDITIVLGLVGSIFFITIALFFSIIKIILGFKSMFEHGISQDASPSLWVMIPLLTLVGITFVRQRHGLHTSLDAHSGTSDLFIVTTVILSLQMIFGFLGYKVMRANNYFKEYLHGKKKSPGMYALVCPGVALFIFGFFFIHLGLIKTGVVDKFSIFYFLLLLPLLWLQYKTVATLRKINKKLF